MKICSVLQSLAFIQSFRIYVQSYVQAASEEYISILYKKTMQKMSQAVKRLVKLKKGFLKASIALENMINCCVQ